MRVNRRTWVMVLLMASLFWGCSDEGLQRASLTAQDHPQLQKAVTDLEQQLATGLDAYLRLVSVAGREAYYFDALDHRYTAALLEGQEVGTYFLAHNSWRAREQTIAAADLLIRQLDRLDLTYAEREAMTGWARTWQAYETLLNLNLSFDYGLPMGKRAPGMFVGLEDCLDAISVELDQAYEHLMTGGDQFPVHLGDGFAMFDTPRSFAQLNRAFAARVHAYRGDGQALLAALDASFLETDGPLRIGAFHLYPKAHHGGAANPLFEPQQGASHRWLVHPSFVQEAAEGDRRLSAKVQTLDMPVLRDSLESSWVPKVAFAPNAPLPIIHNEELILLRAEGLLLTGDLYGAEDLLNHLREQAQVERLWLTEEDEAWQALRHERRYALFLEGHRWIDMRRFSQLDQLPLDREFGEAGPMRGPDRPLIRIAPPQ